jgi:hypothetical protein
MAMQKEVAASVNLAERIINLLEESGVSETEKISAMKIAKAMLPISLRASRSGATLSSASQTQYSQESSSSLEV